MKSGTNRIRKNRLKSKVAFSPFNSLYDEDVSKGFGTD